MKEILAEIYLLESLSGANVYLLTGNNRLALVDSGMPGNARRIVDQITAGGFDSSELKQILITHSHVDHVGSLAELVQLTNARVAAHRDEVPYIQREKTLPAQSWSRRFLNRLTSLIVRVEPVHVDRILQDGDEVDVLGGLEVIHTPGHTPGSICYYHPEHKILFCGDALLNRNPVSGKAGLQLPLNSVTTDTDLARRSVEKLSDLQIEALLPGHGEPLLGDVNQKITNLLRE